MRRAFDVRFTPESGQIADIARLPKCADTVEKVAAKSL
jgi:hypothetical protein